MTVSAKRNSVVKALAALAALVPILAAGPAAAHPHAWIDLVSHVGFDAQGRITGIVEEWLFDEFYTAFIIDGIDAEPKARQAALERLARTNLDNLREHGYFTDFRIDDRRVAVGEVGEVETALRDRRLWMRFTVPLAEPIPVRGQWIGYAVYDPSYFVEMLHVEGFAPTLKTPPGLSCTASLTPPSPSPETRRLAFALDRTQNAGDSLGVHFAEWVTLKCE